MKYVLIMIVVAAFTAQAGIFGSEKVPSNTHSPEKDYDTVNGSIKVGDNAHVDDLDTVNGSIRVGAESIVGKVETVNGSIRFQDGVAAERVETVNGSLVLGQHCRIERKAATVNGSISAGKGCQIGGKVETVNGKIEAKGAEIGANIETVNGNVILSAGTVVKGDVIIDKPSGWFNSNKQVPEVHIGDDVIVEGDLVFKRTVKLYVADSAKIGEVIGDDIIEM